MKNKKILILLVLAALLGLAAIIVKNYATKTSFKFDKNEETEIEHHDQDKVNEAVNEAAEKNRVVKNSELLKILPGDFIYGDKSAPLTMIEYASLSCPHCAMFYREAFEKLKTEYIDTKKVKFIYRDFPLNQQALSAAMVARCIVDEEQTDKSARYYSTIKALFKTQDVWAFDQKYLEKLEAVARLDGMSPDSFSNCINNSKLQNKILQDRLDAAKLLQLRSTPTFFVNGEVLEGYVDYLTIKKAIEKKLSEIK